MAYVQNLDEEKDQQTPAAPAPASGGQSNAIGGASAPAAIGGTANTPAGQKASSGRFTNIQKYLGANQGAGEQVATGVANQVEQNVAPQKAQANTSFNTVSGSIGTANDTLARGTAMNKDLSSNNPFALATASNTANPVTAPSLNPANASFNSNAQPGLDYWTDPRNIVDRGALNKNNPGPVNFDPLTFSNNPHIKSLGTSATGTDVIGGEYLSGFSALTPDKQASYKAARDAIGKTVGTDSYDMGSWGKLDADYGIKDLGSINLDVANHAEVSPQPISKPVGTDIAGTIFDETLGNKYQTLANDQSKLQDFTKFRLGQNVDETGLKNQGADSLTNSGVFQTAAQEQLNNASNENGRFSLMKQAFARPNYSTGQQRLDNTFFGTSGKAGIGKVQDVANQNINAANQLNTNSTKALSDITGDNGIIAQNQALSKDFTGTAKGLLDSYNATLEARKDPTKQAYTDEIARYRSNIGLLTQDPTSVKGDKSIDQDIWDQTKLQGGEQTFNSLNGLNLEQLAAVNDLTGKQLSNQDVSKQGDVNTMLALNAMNQATLDKDGNVVKNYVDPYTTASQLGNAVTLNTDNTGIMGRITDAQKTFLAQAAQDTLTGTGSDTYGSLPWDKGTATASSSANVGDLLKNSGYIPTGGSKDIKNQTVNQLSGALGAVNPMYAAATQLWAGGLKSVGDALGVDNGHSGAQRSADIQAQNNLQAQIADYMKNKGFNTAVTRNGTVDTSKFQDAIRSGNLQATQAGNELGRYGLTGTATADQAKSAADAYALQMAQNAYFDKQLSGDWRVNRGAPVPTLSTINSIDDQRAIGDMLNRYNAGQTAVSSNQASMYDLLGIKAPGDVSTQVEQPTSDAMTLDQILASRGKV